MLGLSFLGLLFRVPVARSERERLVSLRPFVLEVPNFASAEERQGLLDLIDRCHRKEWTECNEVQSKLVAKTKLRTDGNSSRPLRNSTSFMLTLPGEIHPSVDHIVRRSHALARHPLTYGEGVQIASYRDGDYYGFHHDSLMRRATVLLYLTDVAEGDGGETIFPLVRAPGIPDDAAPPLPPAVTGGRGDGLDFKVSHMEEMMPYCLSDFYLKVRPEAGKAVLFYSYRPDYSLDEYAIHGACPVRNGGHKAIFQRWMRFEENSLMGKAEEAVRRVRTELGRARLLLPAPRPQDINASSDEQQALAGRHRRRRREPEGLADGLASDGNASGAGSDQAAADDGTSPLEL